MYVRYHVHMHLCLVQVPTINYKKEMICKLITVLNNSSTVKDLKTEFEITCKYIISLIHHNSKCSIVFIENATMLPNHCLNSNCYDTCIAHSLQGANDVQSMTSIH